MISINPFHEYWKRENYDSWFKYIIGVPLITLFISYLFLMIYGTTFIYKIISLPLKIKRWFR
ncbi:hypothetical protein IEA_05681 [Bacillus toyonensis]|nr:hypothetical protein IEA_05681 [Bacillus toyonensis]